MRPLDRRNNNMSGFWERPLLAWLAPRLPAWVSSDALTALGLGGAVLASVGFAMSGTWRCALLLSILGGVINWFGDSLDGTIARLRGRERPVYGYLIDQGTDLVAATIAFVGLGLCPWVRMDVALGTLAVYLLHANLSHMRAAVTGIYDIAPSRIGGTEMRLGWIALTLSMLVLEPAHVVAGWPFSLQDLAVAGVGVLGAFGFLIALAMEARAARPD